nr:hypothetical protein GCM10020093_032940 [Planobispora longispora]
MPTDLSPTARALRAMQILQARPGVTAGELAACLGVTERAARRYVGILREAGIPVESVRGPYGGYRLGRGTRLPAVAFTEPEALGLVMAVLNGQPAAADVGDLVGTALGKIIRALPENVGRQAATLREYASAAPDRLSACPDPATTSVLVTAIADRRRVVVAYRSESGNQWKTEVDPWAVVVRHGRWYLLCHCHRADAVRTYRVDRVLQVQQSTHTFEPPDDLDPVAALEENLGTGWEFATRVVFDAPRPRWRLGSGRRWEGSNRRGTGACSSAARATRRCMRRSGCRTCRSPSASRAARNCVPPSRVSLRVSPPPWGSAHGRRHVRAGVFGGGTERIIPVRSPRGCPGRPGTGQARPRAPGRSAAPGEPADLPMPADGAILEWTTHPTRPEALLLMAAGPTRHGSTATTATPSRTPGSRPAHRWTSTRCTHAPARDGTPIPLTVIHHKESRPDAAGGRTRSGGPCRWRRRGP